MDQNQLEKEKKNTLLFLLLTNVRERGNDLR